MAFRYASASSNLMVNDINGGKLSLGSYAMQFDGYGAVVQKVLPEYRSAQIVSVPKHDIRIIGKFLGSLGKI